MFPVETASGGQVTGLSLASEHAIQLWLASFPSRNTQLAYQGELQAFAQFAGYENAATAVTAFLRLTDAQARAVADAWRASKIGKGLAPATVNRSMAALNSFVTSARRHGLTTLRLEARGLKSMTYRDTAGPGLKGIQTLLEYARSQKDPQKATRDEAILRLAFACGLRRGEIVSLDIGHVDLVAKEITVLGKGHLDRVKLSIPPNVHAALARWLDHRGAAEAREPLFINLTRDQVHTRLTGAGVYAIIRDQLGRKAGILARPHGLRHTAITAALDTFNGDYRKTRTFSRHTSIETVRRYDDNRADHAGQIAQVLDGLCG